MGKLTKSQFKFNKHEGVGAEPAELDGEFLADCFCDYGDLETLRDCTKPNCIVVGRTGSGKSALLLRLAEVEEHVVQLQAENLSLQYLSNSNVLRYLNKIGVNLGLFYKLLWRHIFAVELIKAKCELKTETQTKTFTQMFLGLFGKGKVKEDKAKERAIEYVVDWGQSFWKDTEYRIREVTSKLEENVKAQLGADFHFAEAGVSAEDKASVEVKGEIKSRAQQVVDGIQLQRLNEVNRLLRTPETIT